MMDFISKVIVNTLQLTLIMGFSILLCGFFLSPILIMIQTNNPLYALLYLPIAGTLYTLLESNR